jgi:glyoxylase-like metal-dependent hydrolase (beta-lactamase superfamily II)
MFSSSRVRCNPIALVVWFLAFASGCALQRFLRVEERRIDAHLLFFLGGGGNSLVLTHGREAFVADTKFGQASRLMRHRVEEELSRLVRRAMVTHSHFDHSGGLDGLMHVGPVLVHPRAKQRLEEQGVHANWVEVDRPMQLQLGDEVVHVWSPGRGHTDGDLVATLEHRKVLMTGDLFTEASEPVVVERSGGDILEWRSTLDALLTLDFVTVLPGHGEPVERDALERFRDYLLLVEQEVRGAQAKGLDEDQVVATVSLAQAPILASVPFVGTRERTVRMMARALKAHAVVTSPRLP